MPTWVSRRPRLRITWNSGIRMELPGSICDINHEHEQQGGAAESKAGKGIGGPDTESQGNHRGRQRDSRAVHEVADEGGFLPDVEIGVKGQRLRPHHRGRLRHFGDRPDRRAHHPYQGQHQEEDEQAAQPVTEAGPDSILRPLFHAGLVSALFSANSTRMKTMLMARRNSSRIIAAAAPRPRRRCSKA